MGKFLTNVYLEKKKENLRSASVSRDESLPKGNSLQASRRTSCAVEEESLPARVLDDHDGSVVVVQAAEDLGRASLQYRDILRLNCLAAG